MKSKICNNLDMMKESQQMLLENTFKERPALKLRSEAGIRNLNTRKLQKPYFPAISINSSDS